MVSLRKMSWTAGCASSSLRVWMQFMMRSLESSSIGTETNLDWPTRMMDAMMSIACRVDQYGHIEAWMREVVTYLSLDGVGLARLLRELGVAEDKLCQRRSEDSTSVEVATENES